MNAPSFAGGVPARTPSPAAVTVHLVGRFHVTAGGRPIDLPSSTHRLVAFLALQDGPVERPYAASSLWMDKTDDRAHANLRSVLWRLRQGDRDLVSASATHLALRADVDVDATALLASARALIDESRPVDVAAVDARSLAVDLLPGWYDDFVEIERDRFRQLRLHALEALSRRLVAAGAFAGALDAALTAVVADPLRESAHRAVIAVHLAEGNTGEAVRQLRTLGELLRRQLGIVPSRQTLDLVASGVSLTPPGDGAVDVTGVLPQPRSPHAAAR